MAGGELSSPARRSPSTLSASPVIIAEEEDTNKRRREEKMDDAKAETPAETYHKMFFHQFDRLGEEMM